MTPALNESLVQSVWEQARAMPERDAGEWRQDQCSAWLHRDHYNHPTSEFGWKIEKIIPDGPELAENLQAFHWNNTFDIANGKPHCRVTSDRTGLAPTQSVDQPHNISK